MTHFKQPCPVGREARLTPFGSRTLLRDASYHLSDAEVARLIAVLSPAVSVTDEGPTVFLSARQVVSGGDTAFYLDYDAVDEVEPDPDLHRYSDHPDFSL